MPKISTEEQDFHEEWRQEGIAKLEVDDEQTDSLLMVIYRTAKAQQRAEGNNTPATPYFHRTRSKTTNKVPQHPGSSHTYLMK